MTNPPYHSCFKTKSSCARQLYCKKAHEITDGGTGEKGKPAKQQLLRNKKRRNDATAKSSEWGQTSCESWDGWDQLRPKTSQKQAKLKKAKGYSGVSRERVAAAPTPTCVPCFVFRRWGWQLANHPTQSNSLQQRFYKDNYDSIRWISRPNRQVSSKVEVLSTVLTSA